MPFVCSEASQSVSGGRRREGERATRVFRELDNDLFAALVAMREHGIWRVSLGEGGKSERCACGGEEAANILERALAVKERA